MKEDLFIQDDVSIPAHEIEITASKASGPGGQHVNKTSTRITVRWNIATTTALTDEQKKRVIEKLASSLTNESELIIHSAASRSQLHNKKEALALLAKKVQAALVQPKKRRKMKISKAAKEARLEMKKRRSMVKKMRNKKDLY